MKRASCFTMGAIIPPTLPVHLQLDSQQCMEMASKANSWGSLPTPAWLPMLHSPVAYFKVKWLISPLILSVNLDLILGMLPKQKPFIAWINLKFTSNLLSSLYLLEQFFNIKKRNNWKARRTTVLYQYNESKYSHFLKIYYWINYKFNLNFQKKKVHWKLFQQS